MPEIYKYKANIPYVGTQAANRLSAGDEFIVVKMFNDGNILVHAYGSGYTIPASFIQFCTRV